MDKYDGSTNPDEHINIYTTQISLYKYLHNTNKFVYLEWCHSLLGISNNFEGSSAKLVYSFTSIIYWLFWYICWEG